VIHEDTKQSILYGDDCKDVCSCQHIIYKETNLVPFDIDHLQALETIDEIEHHLMRNCFNILINLFVKSPNIRYLLMNLRN